MSILLESGLDPERLAECARWDADYGRPTSHALDPRNDSDEEADQWLNADLDGAPVSVNWKACGQVAVIEGFTFGEWHEGKHFIRSEFVAGDVHGEWQKKAQRELRDLLDRAHADAQPGRFAA